MKKNLRRLLIAILSLTVMFAMGTAVFADQEPTVTNLDVQNNFNMFKPTKAELKTVGETKTLELTYASTSYDKAYAGTSMQAVFVGAEESLCQKTDGKYTIPVPATDENFIVAFHSVKNKGWYGRVFKIDTVENTLITDKDGTDIVYDEEATDWDEIGTNESPVSLVVSSLGMFKMERTKITVNDDSTVTIKLKTNPSRQFPRIALIEQTASEEEKEAKAIVGKNADGNNSYVYCFDVPLEQVGSEIPFSTFQIYKGVEEWKNWSNQPTLTISAQSVAEKAIAAAKAAELTDKAKLEVALAAIERLSDEQKEALKDDISIIQDAKTAIDKAEQALKDAEAAIAAAKVDPTNKEKVEAALAAIEKLTEEQKAKLQADIKTIKEAKATIDKLEKDAKEAAEKAAKDAAEKAAQKARELAFNKVTIAAIPAKTYTGKAIKPKLTVKDGSTTLKQGTDYSVAYKNNKNAGKATVTVTAMGDKYSGTKTVNFTINKAKNKLKVKAVKKTFKVKANKKTVIKAKKAFKVTKNVSKGKVTYKKIKGSKKITVSKTGKITVKKGLKKGKTYTVKVKATSKATKNYKSAKVTVTLKIKVKK